MHVSDLVLPTPEVPALASRPWTPGFFSSTLWSQSAMTINFQVQESSEGHQLRWRYAAVVADRR